MSDEAPNPSPRDSGGLVVALDGPASSGKSSVGAAAAKALGYRFCDTGLLYRAVTWLAQHRGVAPDDSAALVRLVDEIHLLDDGTGRLAHVAVDDIDRTTEVRTPEVDVAVSAYSSVAELRGALLARQRTLAREGRIVMAGRDIGTVVLPDADLKLYLDASVAERARRRAAERGFEPGTPEAEEILDELRRRDDLDSNREVAPLRKAADAVVLRTDGNTFEQTVELVVGAIRKAAEAQARAASHTADAEANAADGAAPADASKAPVAASAPLDAAPPDAAPPDAPADAAPELDAAADPAASPRRDRGTRKERRPIEPTPIATRNTVLTRLGTAVLRGIVRAIVRFRVEGDLTTLPKDGPLIMAANHASSADPVLIGAFLNQQLGRPLNWLGKRELLEFPLTGWAFRIAGIHPVDRDAADLEAFRTAMGILEAGQMLAVFPEGTRSRDGALQRVREGVGMLALRSGAPVLPVAVVDSDILWPRGQLLPRYGKRVAVRYGTPFVVADELAARGLPTKGRQATEAATRLVMTRIAELLPPRQRGVYADAAAAAAPPNAGAARAGPV